MPGVAKPAAVDEGHSPPSRPSDQAGARRARVGVRHNNGPQTPLARQAGRVAGIDGVALTKLDVLDSFEIIEICVGGRSNGEPCNRLLASPPPPAPSEADLRNPQGPEHPLPPRRPHSPDLHRPRARRHHPRSRPVRQSIAASARRDWRSPNIVAPRRPICACSGGTRMPPRWEGYGWVWIDALPVAATGRRSTTRRPVAVQTRCGNCRASSGQTIDPGQAVILEHACQQRSAQSCQQFCSAVRFIASPKVALYSALVLPNALRNLTASSSPLIPKYGKWWK